MQKTPAVLFAKQETKETFCVLDYCIGEATNTGLCSNTKCDLSFMQEWIRR